MKKKKNHQKAEKISKLTVNSQCLQNNFSLANINILTLPLNVRTLGMVSKLRAHYPNPFHNTATLDL